LARTALRSIERYSTWSGTWSKQRSGASPLARSRSSPVTFYITIPNIGLIKQSNTHNGGVECSSQIRDCMSIPNNHGLSWQSKSTIHVTAKVILDRLMLVSGPRGFAQFVTIPSAPTTSSAPITPPLTLQLFLDCIVFFSKSKSGPFKDNIFFYT